MLKDVDFDFNEDFRKRLEDVFLESLSDGRAAFAFWNLTRDEQNRLLDFDPDANYDWHSAVGFADVARAAEDFEFGLTEEDLRSAVCTWYENEIKAPDAFVIVGADKVAHYGLQPLMERHRMTLLDGSYYTPAALAYLLKAKDKKLCAKEVEVNPGDSQRLELASGAMRRRGRPPSEKEAKGYMPTKAKCLAMVTFIELKRAGVVLTLADAPAFCKKHQDETVSGMHIPPLSTEVAYDAFSNYRTTARRQFSRWATYNRDVAGLKYTTSQLCEVPDEEWEQIKPTLR